MTNMQIVKVVIKGELPESCSGCTFRYVRLFVDGDKCVLTNQILKTLRTRPDWCPLVLDDTTSTRESDTTDKEGEG